MQQEPLARRADSAVLWFEAFLFSVFQQYDARFAPLSYTPRRVVPPSPYSLELPHHPKKQVNDLHILHKAFEAEKNQHGLLQD